MVRLEELADAEGEGAQAEADVSASLAALRELLSLRPDGSGFQRRYAERVDRVPDVAFAHGVALAHLRRATAAAAA
jgi:hypothetical protein